MHKREKARILNDRRGVSLEAVREANPALYRKLVQAGHSSSSVPLEDLDAEYVEALNRDGLIDPPLTRAELARLKEEEDRF